MQDFYIFRIRRGATESRTIGPWTDSSGNVVNVTGYAALWQLFDSLGNVLLSLTGGAGLTLGGSAGTCGILLTAAQTLALAAGGFFHHLLLTDGSGNVTRLIHGVATVSPG